MRDEIAKDIANLIGKAKAIREFISELTMESRLHLHSTGNMLFYLDHFGVHHIPCYKQSLQEFKSLQGNFSRAYHIY